MSILVVAEHDNESIKAPTLVTVAAAKEIGGDIEVLVAGAGCGAAAEAAAKIDGVSKVLVADNAAYDHNVAENIAALVVVLVVLQNLAGNVQWQVVGIEQTFHKTQIVGHKLRGVVHNKHALYIQF